MAPNPQVIAARPMATATAPFQSSGFAFSSRLSPTKKTASPAAATASGTFSRKIARRAYDQHQRAEQQQVGNDDPPRGSSVRLQRLLDGGQGNIHDRAVDKCHARPEDRRRQRQLLAPSRQRRGSSRRRV